MRQNERALRLDYECLHTMPTGLREVRVWWDDIRGTWIVGKRLDLSEVQDDADLIEPQVMEMIDHPNVVKVQAVATVEGFPHPMRVVEVFMPYYERGSVTDALESGQTFSATESLRIIQAVLRGLREMHEVHKILHRDIKSPNLFLANDASLIKIGDLGLAGSIGPDHTAPSVNAPHLYSPPELLRGNGLTFASDIYSVGAVLRELISGKYNYEAYTKTQIIDDLIAGNIPLRMPDLALPIWACNSLRRVINKATERDPAKRYQSARDMSTFIAKIKTADWIQAPDAQQWEAHSPGRRDSRVRVTASPLRGGLLQICVQRRGKAMWRRAFTDVRVSSLDHADARSMFERANTLAAN